MGGKLKPLVDALKDSGDSLGSHGRRLADLPGKHKTKLDSDLQRRRDTDDDQANRPTPSSSNGNNNGGDTPVTPPKKIQLRYKEGWTDDQIRAADAKVAKLKELADRGELVRVETMVDRPGNLRRLFLRLSGLKKEDIAGYDIDHMIDLQLGGNNDLSNLWKLDPSVNRSLGSQIAHQLDQFAPGEAIPDIGIDFR